MTDIDLEELAIKHKAIKVEPYSGIGSTMFSPVLVFEPDELLAFANEYAAKLSSEPVATLELERREVYNPRLTEYRIEVIEYKRESSDEDSPMRYHSLPDGKYDLFIANPINQALLDSHRRLEEALTKTACNTPIGKFALSRIPATIKDLIGEQ